MSIDVITKPRIRLTRRVNEMQVSPTLAVMNRALELKAQGVDVVDLGPGEPDFPTPPESAVSRSFRPSVDRAYGPHSHRFGSSIRANSPPTTTATPSSPI